MSSVPIDPLPDEARREFGEWAGFPAGPLARFLHLAGIYALTHRARLVHGRLALHVVSVVRPLIAAAGVVRAWLGWGEFGREWPSSLDAAAVGRMRLGQATRVSTDPSHFMVVVEDTAAFLGVVIASLGIFLSHMLGHSWPDGIASILVGLLLGAIAIFLAYESKKLLVGESADRESVASILKLVKDDPAFLHAGPPLTMHLGPEEVLLNLDVQFRPGQSTDDLIEAVDRLERAIGEQHPEMRRIFLEIERLRHQDGRSAPGPRPDVDRPDHPTEPAAAGRTPADS